MHGWAHITCAVWRSQRGAQPACAVAHLQRADGLVNSLLERTPVLRERGAVRVCERAVRAEQLGRGLALRLSAERRPAGEEARGGEGDARQRTTEVTSQMADDR